VPCPFPLQSARAGGRARPAHRLGCTARRLGPSQKGWARFSPYRESDGGGDSNEARARWRNNSKSAAGLAFGTIASAAWSQAIPVYAESAADALARNVKILADSPRNFDALIAAGKAALQVGDTQAAAGFFGRAEEVHPQSPLPKAGMGAAMVATGDPNAALVYFAMAQQLGASVIAFGSDRGLAYDLLGNQVAAQADYRAALHGPDRDEATRRLALSLAISGNKPLALETFSRSLCGATPRPAHPGAGARARRRCRRRENGGRFHHARRVAKHGPILPPACLR
jgi:tetratricopeptide (TPR) repeat protein